MRPPSSTRLVGRLSASILAIGAGGAIAFGTGIAAPTTQPATAATADIADTAVAISANADMASSGPATTSLGGPAELLSAGPLAPACHSPWGAPVDAAVTDPFRPPDHRYGPGNRGIEYGTEPGQDVLAVAGGVVEFAGPVAGRPVIVIDHGAGLRSSYVNLLEGSVGRGLVVGRGQRIAAADAAFHLGARRDRRYVDPADLIERRCLVVRLVAT